MGSFTVPLKPFVFHLSQRVQRRWWTIVLIQFGSICVPGLYMFKGHLAVNLGRSEIWGFLRHVGDSSSAWSPRTKKFWRRCGWQQKSKAWGMCMTILTFPALFCPVAVTLDKAPQGKLSDGEEINKSFECACDGISQHRLGKERQSWCDLNIKKIQEMEIFPG